MRRAALCAAAAAELQALVARLGGSAQDSGSASAAVHRGWVAICAQLADSTDLALLEACEQGDDQALERYRSALADDLPAGVLHLVQQQYDGAKACHAHLRQLRDAARSAATS